MADISVIAGPSSPDLAAGIARRLGADLISTELRIFSDGESKVRLDRPAGKKCVLVQSTHPPTDSNLMQAMMIARKCADDGAKVCAVMPYLAYARQDRAFLEGEGVSAALVARLLEASGVNAIVTVDIHSQMALSYFKNARNVSSIPLLAEHASKMKLKKPLVVSPDAGGADRAEEFARLLKADAVALKKSRDRKTGEVSIEKINFDVSGRDAILVDDMISSGGSIVKAAEVLRKAGAGNVYAMCAHALLVGDAAQRIMASGVKDIVATNSIPGRYAKVDMSAPLADAARSAL
ncbi:MAG: ribose-phosphate diphosphokinase [Nitrososphaera sp.]|uniref:ribose-phosphate diphosphokinase n=1 Tax=Nitrososphaera sp. TaxID=1971748 RepID=UPI003D6FE79F